MNPYLSDKEKFKKIALLFSTRGYHNTTMDEIASTLGIAKGTIYYHFKNKEELYYGVITEGINILTVQLQSALTGTKSFEEKIRILISTQVDYIAEYYPLAYIYLRELYGNRREQLLNMLNNYLDVINDMLIEGMNEGAIKQLDPGIASSSIFGMVYTTALHYISLYKKLPSQLAKRNLEEIVFRGILA
ncbi:MAG: TetR/AcrR family transcriptional regulator [Desulfurispora sp.]|uniref:TetR/AcrR family transcriptional regulator n=1 Tax=Desulfurispora sp. TaxID=3014275 RepID=UPI004049E789